MRNYFLLLGLAGLGFSACQKSSQPTTPPGETAGPTTGDSAGDSAGDGASGSEGGATATEPGAPGVAWADKTFKQRQEYMGLEVLPKMKALFQAHDGGSFGTFKCQTCHGKDMNEKNFKMPTDSIYPLDPADPIKGAMEYDEKITKFMVDEVTPKMAEMLGEKVVSKDNPNGFGCMSCHPAQ